MKKRKCSKTIHLAFVILILAALSCTCSDTGKTDWHGIGCSLWCGLTEDDPNIIRSCIQSCMRKKSDVECPTIARVHTTE